MATRPFNAAEYIASYPDLIAAYGPDPAAGAWHWHHFGQHEGRVVGFAGLDYVASYPDLIAAFGPDPTAGALHWINFGRNEGRVTDAFDGAQYLANYADLQAAFGADEQAAAWHFIVWGVREGRTDDAPATPRGPPPPPAPPPGQVIVGTNKADVLVGTPGDDTILASLGGDTVTGGDGADIFSPGARWTEFGPILWGGFLITDFQPGQDKIDLNNLIADKGFGGVFLDTGPFTTGPFRRDFESYQYIYGDHYNVEVRYDHSHLRDGTPVTTVLFDGPVFIGSAKFNLTPMDGHADIQLNMLGHLDLSAGDFIGLNGYIKSPGRVINEARDYFADELAGGLGDDTIHGGFGDASSGLGDTMTGGGGADVFRFGTRISDLSPAINADTHGDIITDFTQGQDKIDISAFCTDSSGTDRFTGIWIGTDPFSSAGPHPINPDLSSGAPRDVPPEVRYEFHKLGDGQDVTVIQIDGPVALQSLKLGSTPRDGNADAEIVLHGAINLSASDIVL
jgi:hypothetical protein